MDQIPDKNKIINPEEEFQDVVDVRGAEHTAIEWGDRFRGWYLFKNPISTKTLSLNYKDTDLSYRFAINEYRYKFIMPSRLDFVDGTITYSEPERNIGVFRYPQKSPGKYGAPIRNIENIASQVNTLSPDQIKDLMNKRKVLTFEAFRIEQFVFQFFNLSKDAFKEIREITNEGFTQAFEAECVRQLDTQISKVMTGIKNIPNYLLILENVLNLQLRDLDEVSKMTNKIIYT